MAWARYDDMLPMNRKWVTGLRPMGRRTGLTVTITVKERT